MKTIKSFTGYFLILCAYLFRKGLWVLLQKMGQQKRGEMASIAFDNLFIIEEY